MKSKITKHQFFKRRNVAQYTFKYFLTILKVTLIILFGYNVSFGQISAKVFNYRPTGEFGFVMKPAYSAELGYMIPFEDRGSFRLNASITYIVMKPRMESFPIYGLLYKGGGATVLAGKQSFQKYNISLLFVGFDYAMMKKNRFTFYAGTDMVMGGVDSEYTYEIETMITVSYSGGAILGGFRFRLGSEFDVNEHIGIFLNAQRQILLITEPRGLFWANDYGLGMHYSF